jgi:hypothetical protein
MNDLSSGVMLSASAPLFCQRVDTSRAPGSTRPAAYLADEIHHPNLRDA